MIHIINKYNSKKTSLKKVKENLWEFDTKSIQKVYDSGGNYTDSNDITVANSTINKKGIKSFIKELKKFLIEKNKKEKKYIPKWKINPADIYFWFRYYEWDKFPFEIGIYVRNKYLKNFTVSYYMRYGEDNSEKFEWSMYFFKPISFRKIHNRFRRRDLRRSKSKVSKYR